MVYVHAVHSQEQINNASESSLGLKDKETGLVFDIVNERETVGRLKR